MNWATAAAFTAAFLSLVNVGYSYSLTRRGTREQWWREQERPILAQILTVSNDMAEGWLTIGQLKSKPGVKWPDPEVDAALERNSALERELRYQIAQLDLVASPPVRHAARVLSRVHQYPEELSMSDPALESSIDDFGEVGSELELTPLQAGLERIIESEAALVDAARADLGLGRVARVIPLRSGGRI